MDEPLFDSLNAAYAQAMFEQYARNPESVPDGWQRYFGDGGSRAESDGLIVPEQLNGHRQSVTAVVAPPQAATAPVAPTAPTPTIAATPATRVSDEGSPDVNESLRRALPVVSRAAALLQAFRDHGHRLARIDPLGSEPPGHPQLTPSFFGTTMEELDELPASLVVENGRSGSVSDALNELREVYAGSVGYEFEHLDDHVRVDWLWEQVAQGTHRAELSKEERIELLEGLTSTEGLEQFLGRAYLGQKRFSVEGNDILVPMLRRALREALKDGAREVVLGMAHRGRLNVLTHILGVSYSELLAEFEGPSMKGGALDVPGTGDVKYHHGARGTMEFDSLGSIRVDLMPNPSHLEFVNPVVDGVARARQFSGPSRGDEPDPRCVVPVLMHGDAAFAAEGVVAESLNMARLHGYDVGGTIHIIVNNQVGFTTDPQEGRSTAYSSDLAKGYGIPVVHVNADDPEACMAAVRLAMAYRAEFLDDFVIDLVGYRRHGHNEGDEPSYTQPILYKKIKDHPTVRTLYAEELVERGVLSGEEAEAMVERVADTLRSAQDHVRSLDESDLPSGDVVVDAEYETPVVPETTGVAFEDLSAVNDALLTLPEGFSPHPKLWRQLSRRGDEWGPDKSLDWGHAEALAFGSLLLDGIPVRLTGQDSQRGTFSHRHLVLHDVDNGVELMPLRQVADTRIEVYNSPLTETATIGFEYGYSVGADRDLVLWEAQFGDFVNVAQVMIDQFLSSGFTKWGQYSRLVLLLPHGHEGQGPEHSSARLERFLQLCAEGNMRITYPTTPAQYFHMLRRQALRRPERPLVVMTPKSLLRHPSATSPVSDLTEGNFLHVIADPTVEDASSVRRLVLCSGKVYYDIQGHDRRGAATAAAVARMELLYPFPMDALQTLLSQYPNLKEVVWAQEEPRNMGALTFVGPRLRAVVPRTIPMSHVARPDRASPAEGKARKHAQHQEEVVLDALGLSASD